MLLPGKVWHSSISRSASDPGHTIFYFFVCLRSVIEFLFIIL